jgi:hypothetical protein
MDMLEIDLSGEGKKNNETKLHGTEPAIDENVDIITVEAEFPKYSVSEILEAAEQIDPEKVASEVLVWLDVNLENYIDNHAKMFQIPLDDLDVEAGSKCDMTETKRLQSLYRGIPEDSFMACRNELDKLTEKCHDGMQENKKLLVKLFDRMIYYYEFRGFSNDGKELISNLEGLVSILKFEYESFSVGVTIREGMTPENENDPDSRKTLKEYVIPEGFIIWTEIAMKKTERPRGMF